MENTNKQSNKKKRSKALRPNYIGNGVWGLMDVQTGKYMIEVYLFEHLSVQEVSDFLNEVACLYEDLYKQAISNMQRGL